MTAHDTRVLAILPLGSTTITASRVPGITGIAVIDGSTTLTVRHPGITLPGGEVVVLGFAGIYDAETTGLFATYTGDQTPTVVQPIYPTAVGVGAAYTAPPATTTSTSVERVSSKSKSHSHSHSDEHTIRTTSFSSRMSTSTRDASSTASAVVNVVSALASSSAAATTTSAQGSAAIHVSPRYLVVAALLMSVLVGVAA